MSVCRETRKPLESVRRIRITRRDRAIIADIALFGAATRTQLMQLGHFGSVSRANRRLRLLVDAKFLRRAYIAIGPSQNSTIYIIGPSGSSVAAEECGLDPGEMRRHGQRCPERMYLEHHLGVLSLRVVARRMAGKARLRRFLAEPDCRHEYEIADRGRATRRLIKPDAMAIFEVGDSSISVFIEFDRGKTSLPQMAAQFGRYNRYWADAAYQYAYETQTPFTVAVVTTAGNRRIDHLIWLTRGSVVPVKITTLAQLESQGFDALIWRSSKAKGFSSLWDPLPSGGGP